MPLIASSSVRRIDLVPVAPVSLLERLARRLNSEDLLYCQWKGHWAEHRWATGKGDLDLLVDRRDLSAIRRVVEDLGFRPAVPSGSRQLPGTEHYYGFDPKVGGLLHLHIHYRLLLGDFWRTTYRLPIERHLLETSISGTLFKVPSPEYQLLIYVFRLVLRQRGRLPPRRWFAGVQIQLDDLDDRCCRDTLKHCLRQHLPLIDLSFFDSCVRWLREQCGTFGRIAVPLQLHQRLRAHAVRPGFVPVLVAIAEKILPAEITGRLCDGRMRPAEGGVVVALIGGDGSGKSTCATELERWLQSDFVTMRAQLGNPPRSALTLVVGGALKLERLIRTRLHSKMPATSPLSLLRYLCSARDRYRLYRRVHRFAGAGGIAVCERYPVAEIPSHVGPTIPPLLSANPGRLAQFLARQETSIYSRMLRPDMLFVLQLDPELAVTRKPEEPAEYVRRRGRAVWAVDWATTGAQVIDASRPLPEVLDDLKSRIWPNL